MSTLDSENIDETSKAQHYSEGSVNEDHRMYCSALKNYVASTPREPLNIGEKIRVKFLI